MRRKLSTIGLTLIGSLMILILPAAAAAPTGDDTFQLLASPSTGGDNTGDGGTGLASDLNYYYVGQSFTTTIEIKSGGTDAGNIWIDYDTDNSTASGLTSGSYYDAYAGESIAGGRVMQTGFNPDASTSSGTGTFGSLTWTVDEPNALSLVETTPETLDINVGTIGATTESNISLLGSDILDDEEDFSLHLWADITKPFAETPSPADTATGVAVESNYTFELRDTKNGEGDNSGVGTGVDTSEPPGVIEFNSVSETDDSSFSCSGTWGSNLCDVTVNPDPPSGISGDTRNFEYSTLYTVDISGFTDLASASQDQLGEANGPNTMDPKSFTFTTEADTVAPEVVAETPARGSTGNSVSTNITIDVHDKKTYPGTVSGTGVVSSTCDFNVSSPTFALTTFEQGDAEVTVTAIDYGFRFEIDPTTDFGINETVSVTAFNCEDVAGNTMVSDTWTWTTADNIDPFVDQRVPDNDNLAATDTNVIFHIKDTGSGVDLSEVVIFINGEYWTDGGGAGTVTTSGTTISFTSSNDFNGGNYAGDTTSLSGTAADYTFTIDPETDFTGAEAVPVLIYADDLDGNSMQRDVYAFVVEGAGVSGGTSGGGSGTTGGGGRVFPEINDEGLSIIQIDEDSVLISWTTNVRGSGQIIYDVESQDDFQPDQPNAGYRFNSSIQDNVSLIHQVVIDDLQAGTLYYFRPVSELQGHTIYGPELIMAPRFPTLFVEVEAECEAPDLAALCPAPAVVEIPVETPGAPIFVPSPAPILPAPPSLAEGADIQPIVAPVIPLTQFEIVDIDKVRRGFNVFGRGKPNSTVILIVE